MGRHFGGLCPSRAPFPCLDGCNTSYQLCAHLPPAQLRPGYFRSNRHLRAAPDRYAQFSVARASVLRAAVLAWAAPPRPDEGRRLREIAGDCGRLREVRAS